MPDPYNPQSLNRYSYVGNSPLNYTDPTGHERLRDGPTQDDFSQSVYDQYMPIPDNDDDNPGGGGGGGGADDRGNDHTDLVTNLDLLDLIFDPFYGHVWYGFTEGHPEAAFEYRRMLRELMMSGLYGPDSYAALRLQVALALAQAGGKPGSNNVIPTSSGELDNILATRVGWEPYDRFLFNMSLGTGHDNAANYEPYFLQGLMNTDAGRDALDRAKRDYLAHRSLSTDAEILKYLMNSCSGCAGP